MGLTAACLPSQAKGLSQALEMVDPQTGTDILYSVRSHGLCATRQKKRAVFIVWYTNFFLSLSVPPLFVIEFLHRIVDIFTQYFSECTEQRIKDHYVIVYEVTTWEGGGMREGIGVLAFCVCV